MEQTMSQDSDLQLAVLAELAWQPSVVAAHIGVTAEHGVVTLSGHVDSFAQKHAAQEAASRVKGVKAVAEELTVKLAFESERADDDIAMAALDRLSWDVSVPKDSVRVVAEKGWVTLTGEVGWHYQKEAAEHDIRPLMGVVGLSNQITIKPHVNTFNLADNIQHALHRSYFFDAETVKVAAVDGNIRLSGSVRSWQDRQIAAQTAWAAPGAVAVENDIVVV
jgi:osmotically-inducible protein OsmY